MDATSDDRPVIYMYRSNDIDFEFWCSDLMGEKCRQFGDFDMDIDVMAQWAFLNKKHHYIAGQNQPEWINGDFCCRRLWAAMDWQPAVVFDRFFEDKPQVAYMSVSICYERQSKGGRRCVSVWRGVVDLDWSEN